MAEVVAVKVSELEVDEIDDALAKDCTELLRRIGLLRNETLNLLFNSNSQQAIPVYLSLLDYADQVLSRLDGWTSTRSIYRKQSQLFKEFNRVRTQYKVIAREATDLEQKVAAINQAKETADNLPATLQLLVSASEDARRFRDEALTSSAKVNELKENVNNIVEQLERVKKEAMDIVASASTAYSAATAKGLSQAFHTRSQRLRESMRWWVGGLAAALVGAIILGLYRFSELSATLKDTSSHWYSIAIQLGMTIVSIAAPLWYAWLASKQVAYLFKIEEDYAFKASVAQAYEGFRLETLKYDKPYAERLLATALARLDEEPLRYVDRANHSSPLAEAAGSPILAKAAATVPHVVATSGKGDGKDDGSRKAD